MPSEDRRIIFKMDETYKAIYALCVQREIRKPPPGSIANIKEDVGDKNKVTLRIENMLENTNMGVEYCRSLSIPISKKASKSVEFNADNVVLRLRID